ncbi:MAG: peptidoglycan-binding domain-containing protein, partial [Rhodobacteraceae bacterium]|nr:peptidoglycan-binding domain-containing protein [Paracoccaceae bacterium]
QQLLVRLGHDVGNIDGIIGKRTRAAVKSEQMRLNLPADEWPTRDLLDLLTTHAPRGE